ncbi:MAG: rhomboid family intramembrane serine protease [Gammaproteobacteria bacterium]|nr:rhomboid family intramembrane serine protease [Gammaproteobacteria bacterium]
MFPIRDDNPHFNTPYATYAIIAVNVLVWAFVQGFGATLPLVRSLCVLGLIPAQLLAVAPTGTTIPLGPGLECVLTDGPAWYTVFSSMFMHGGWLHIIGNMWFLWIFGNNVEDAMGSVRFVLFYLLCGVAAAASQIASDPASVIPMVGASGAIGGVMGAYIVLYPRVHVHLLVFLGFFVTTFAVPAVFMLAYWFVYQIVSGVWSLGAQGGGVAFWAHAGGFAAGMVLVWLFRDKRLLLRHPYHGWRQPRSPHRSWRRIDR